MRYYSTRNRENTATLAQAVLGGLADDGGLYLPERIPTLPRAFINNMQAMTLQEVSYAVASYAMQAGDQAGRLRDIVYDTLNFPIPLHYVAGNRYVLELFHGPTMSFKDIGARFMARLMASHARQGRGPVNVLVATGGNSGGAVACGFHNIPGIRVIVLFPQDALTPLQEAQFSTLGGNVTALEVNGTLDDCKQLVMDAFADRELASRMTLTSAKTINIARLLPQMFYYFWAYAQLQQRGQDVSQLVVSVPCGNLGNLTAGVMARRMGLPIKRFIAADNSNDTFTRYLATGDFVPCESHPSIAPAIDIGNPRNFPRLMDLYGGSHAAMCQEMQPAAYTDAEIAQTMRLTWQQEDYLLDPQSAAAYRGLCYCLQPGETGVALATGHPAKYREIVQQVTGARVPVPPALSRFLGGKRRVRRLSNGYASFRQFLLGR